MMKLYRPLCSDVTLRLAVDISPTYDDSDEETFDDNADEDNSSIEDKNQLPDSNKFKGHNPHPEVPHLRNQNLRQHNSSRGHNHSCSWYSRLNTPDKTAKDIYNQEHVADSALDNIQTVSLDSEFKRCVEEEGNDFKEDSEQVDNRLTGHHPTTSSLGATNTLNYRRTIHQYLYQEAPGCFDQDDEAPYDAPTSHILLDADNSRYGFTDGPGTSAADNSHWSCQKIQVDRNDNYCPQGRPANSSDDGIGGNDLDGDSDDVFFLPTEQLPVDLDEDVDVVDRLVMRQSMISSVEGELDESDEGVEDLAQSMHVDEIPSEMTKSIAEEIHEVLLGGDDQSDWTQDQLTKPSDHELPFSYPFTLKHVGHLFDKSRHHFMATESRNRTSSQSSLSTSPHFDSGVQTTHHCTPSPPIGCTQPINSFSQSLSSYSQSNSSCWQPSSNSSHSSRIINSQPGDSYCPQANNTKIKSNFEANKINCQVLKPTKAGEDGRQKCSVSTMTAVSSLELEVTHRGLHRFIPRHKDEMNIGIGDPIHVIKECDDLWCEGINLRTGERGIFPAMYANDLNFLEESDDEDEYWKFSMRFLGSVEVGSHKGDETLVHAINKVALSHKGNVHVASLSTLEINQYGIRMIDKSKEGHEKDAFSHFFALKNISFCGTHPKDNRYFAFITKHPRDYKFACHVFRGDRPTHRARDALGEAFKRFYQEYMAFTHPTEDIYME